MRESAVMISSTMPSAKYSRSGSPLILAKGSTAIDGLSGSARGDFRSALPSADPNAVDMHRAGDVLDLLLALVIKGEIELVTHLVADNPADADPAGLGQSFEAGGDIDTVAK